MDSRIESIEKNLTLLDDGFFKLKSDNESIHSKLASIENLLQTLNRGKQIMEEGEVSTQLSPNSNTVTQPSTPSLSIHFPIDTTPFSKILKEPASMALTLLVGSPQSSNTLN